LLFKCEDRPALRDISTTKMCQLKTFLLGLSVTIYLPQEISGYTDGTSLEACLDTISKYPNHITKKFDPLVHEIQVKSSQKKKYKSQLNRLQISLWIFDFFIVKITGYSVKLGSRRSP
jgi:hypothetical protein